MPRCLIRSPAPRPAPSLACGLRAALFAAVAIVWAAHACATNARGLPGHALPPLPVVIEAGALVAMDGGVLALAGDQAWQLETGADRWQLRRWKDTPILPPVANAGGRGVAWMVVPPRTSQQRGMLEEVHLRSGMLTRRRSVPLPRALDHVHLAADARLLAFAGMDGLRRLRVYLLPVDGGGNDWLALPFPATDSSSLPDGLAWLDDGLYLTLHGARSSVLWRWTLGQGWQQRSPPGGPLVPGTLQAGRSRRLLALVQGREQRVVDYDPARDRWSRLALDAPFPADVAISNGNHLTIGRAERGQTRLRQWRLWPPSAAQALPAVVPALAVLIACIVLLRRALQRGHSPGPAATSLASMAPAGLAALLVCVVAASDVRRATYAGGWPSLGLLLVGTTLSIALLLTSALLIAQGRAWLSHVRVREQERPLLHRTQTTLRLLLELGIRLPLLILIPAHGLAWLSGYPVTACILAQAAVVAAIMMLALWKPALRTHALVVTGALLVAGGTLLPPPITSMPLLTLRGGPWELGPLQLAAWCAAVLLLPMAIRFRDPRCRRVATPKDTASTASHWWALTMVGLLIVLVCAPLLAALRVFHQHHVHLADLVPVPPSILVLAMPVAWPPTAAGIIVGGLMVLSLVPLLEDMRGLRMRRRLCSVASAPRGRSRRLLEGVPLVIVTGVALAVAGIRMDLVQDVSLYICVLGVGIVGVTSLVARLARA